MRRIWKTAAALILLLCVSAAGCHSKKETDDSATIAAQTETDSQTLESETSIPVETETTTIEQSETETHTLEIEDSERLWSMAEIEEWNKSLYDTAGLMMTDLTAIPETISGQEIRAQIEQTAFPDKNLLAGVPVTAEAKAAILALRNLDQIPEQIAVQSAIVTEYSAIRSFPTEQVLQDTACANTQFQEDFDYFQETGIAPGNCVWICHKTADGGWSYVITEEYHGWIRSDHLAQITKEQLAEQVSMQRTGEQALVTLEYLDLEGYHLPMGTALPIERETSDAWSVALPKRSADGALEAVSVTIYKTDERFHAGYLPFTEDLLKKQGERCIGIPYGWGDQGGNPDCSSTIQAIYHCFGIRLPRNSSSMNQLPCFRREFAGDGETPASLRDLPLGTILYVPGHVMLYWGQDAEGHDLILHNTTRFRSPEGGELQRIRQCVLTRADIHNVNDQLMNCCFRAAICLWKK